MICTSSLSLWYYLSNSPCLASFPESISSKAQHILVFSTQGLSLLLLFYSENWGCSFSNSRDCYFKSFYLYKLITVLLPVWPLVDYLTASLNLFSQPSSMDNNYVHFMGLYFEVKEVIMTFSIPNPLSMHNECYQLWLI